jgi:hypothetical protein
MPAKAKQQSARGGRDCGWLEIRPGFGVVQSLPCSTNIRTPKLCEDMKTAD